VSSIRDLLENLNGLFGLKISRSALDCLEKNNEFFTECGMLAVEIAVRSPHGLNWSDYGRMWWQKVRKAKLSQASHRELLALSYLVYASKEFGPMHLPTGMRTLVTLHRCSFPGCGSVEDLQEDHVWPQSLGGPDYAWNRQLLCGRHNRMKSNFPGLNFCDPAPLRDALAISFR
jgi:hypothetical protein